MLTPYWGEFLCHVVPLEMTLGRCSNGCIYCFANLNKKERDPQLAADMRLLRDFGKRKTLVAHLLQEGYPVLISNRTDAFSASVYRQALPLMKVMAEMGIPMHFQTRGGHGIDDALEFLPRSVWDVTIETLDDELGRRLSPGSPLPSQRLQLLRRLADLGHVTYASVCPNVPEWVQDADRLMRAIKDAGCYGVWIEPLHINYKQRREMPERDQEFMGDALLRHANPHLESKADIEWRRSVEQAAAGVGLESFTSSLDKPSRFWDATRDVFPKTYPSLQDFINWCDETQPRVVTFDDFWRELGPRLPTGEWHLDSVLASVTHQIWRDHQVPKRMTYEQLLAVLWEESRFHWNPAQKTLFAYALEATEDGIAPMLDGRGMRKMVFVPEHTYQWWEMG